MKKILIGQQKKKKKLNNNNNKINKIHLKCNNRRVKIQGSSGIRNNISVVEGLMMVKVIRKWNSQLNYKKSDKNK